MTVTLDSVVAKDLIETKLRVLDDKIADILNKWQIESIDELLEGARTGQLEESESDASEVQNLADKRKEIEKLLLSL